MEVLANKKPIEEQADSMDINQHLLIARTGPETMNY